MRRIIIEVRDGKVKVDFQGFIGRTCFEEHDRLRRLLEQLGIKYENVKIREKPEARLTVGEKHETTVNY